MSATPEARHRPSSDCDRHEECRQMLSVRMAAYNGVVGALAAASGRSVLDVEVANLNSKARQAFEGESR